MDLGRVAHAEVELSEVHAHGCTRALTFPQVLLLGRTCHREWHLVAWPASLSPFAGRLHCTVSSDWTGNRHGIETRYSSRSYGTARRIYSAQAGPTMRSGDRRSISLVVATDRRSRLSLIRRRPSPRDRGQPTTFLRRHHETTGTGGTTEWPGRSQQAVTFREQSVVLALKTRGLYLMKADPSDRTLGDVKND